MIILNTKGLTRRFGSLTAVNHLSFSVNAGEVFGLLGPNAAGKSTLIKMLVTLLPASSGTAEIAGFDISRQAASVRRIIGYVPQELSADGTLTGYENLWILSKLYDIPRAERASRVEEALSFMGLSHAADKPVRHYSGGMIRRLEIAQSILHRPRLLFLDEPTVGLDPVALKAVWDYVEELRSRFSMTFFLTTHSMEEAAHLCTRIAIMHRGRIVASGTPLELMDSLDKEGATLEDVFIHYSGDSLETRGNYRETSTTRRVARRRG